MLKVHAAVEVCSQLHTTCSTPTAPSYSFLELRKLTLITRSCYCDSGDRIAGTGFQQGPIVYKTRANRDWCVWLTGYHEFSFFGRLYNRLVR